MTGLTLLRAELAGLSGDDRREKNQFAVGRKREDGIGDFLRGLASNNFPGLRVVRHAEGGVEYAQVIVDLGRRGDGGAGTGGGCALLDGDRGGQSLDEIHIGAFETVEELAGVSGETFDVFALALGIERVEGEGRFARTAGTSEHNEAVAGNDDVDVLEIVLSRTLNANGIGLGRSHAR